MSDSPYLNEDNKPDDEKIMADILSSDLKLQENALTFLYEHNFSFVIQMRGKYSILHKHELIENYGEALLTVKREVLDGKFERRAKLSVYLISIFKNKCIDAIRKKTSNKRRRILYRAFGSGEIEETVKDDSPIDVLEEKEEEARERREQENRKVIFRKAMQQIGDQCKKILLAEANGVKRPQMVTLFDLKNTHTVRQTIYTCKKKLMKLIQGLKVQTQKA